MTVIRFFARVGLSLFVLATPALASVTEREPITVPPPPAGKAEVVFFRAGGYVGSAISCPVKEDEKKISSLPPGSFFILVAEPRKHKYVSSSSSEEGVFISLNPGEIHYVRCTIHPGFWAGKGSLDVAKDEELTSKLWKSVDPTKTSANVLTDEQIKAANVAQANVTPAASTPAVVTPAVSPPVAATPATPTAPAASPTPSSTPAPATPASPPAGNAPTTPQP